MTSQLTLIDSEPASWKIPASTREIGRRGLAEARAVLHSIPRRFDDEAHTDDHHEHPAAA